MNNLDPPLQSPALYNPHLLSKQELVGLFSARQALLEELLQDLRSAPPGELAQHHLVVGQRGMGKTMLLRRLKFGVEDDPVLRETWFPLSFPEEQYNVAALSDFWLNCVDAMTDALEDQGRSETVKDLDRAVEALRRVDEEGERARRALDVLAGTAEKLGKRLLLLVDNADLVLDRIGGEDEEWSLRETLSSRPAVTFIGASAAALESAYEYGKAFYDFFRIHELGGLSEEETRRLLLRYAEAQDNDQVRELIEKDPGRLRTLHTLTGGNPRTVVLLFNIFAQGPDGDVRSDLERLLDQCTPLYKARFEALPAQAQQVVDALALHWDPASAGELAEKVRLPVNTVSAQLNRLVREGVVEKVPYEPASKTGFQLAERFFNIWYLMRASRRVRRRLIWLVEFLRMFYGQEELREYVGRHLRLGAAIPPEARLRHAEFSFALAFALEDRDVRGVLERSGLQMLIGHEELRNSLRDLVDIDAAEPEFKNRAEYLEKFASLRKALARVARSRNLPQHLSQCLLRAPVAITEKEKVVQGLMQAGIEEIERLSTSLETFEGVFFGFLPPTDLQEQLLAALHRGDMTALDDVDGARLAEEATGSAGLVAVAAALRALFSKDKGELDDMIAHLGEANVPFPWFVWLQKLGKSAEPHEVESAIQRAAELSVGQFEAIVALGQLAVSFNHLDRAEELYRQAIALNPERGVEWGHLAGVIERQGRIHEAEDTYRRALELEPQSAWVWSQLGSLLGGQGRLAEAEDAFLTALELDQELAPIIWGKRGLFAWSEGRLDDTEGAFREAIEANPTLSFPWTILGLLLEVQGRVKEAEETYWKATELEPRGSMPWARLTILFSRAGRRGEALETSRRALELGPIDRNSKHELAWVLFELDRHLVQAAALASEVAEAERSPEASHTLACILVRRGKWNEAVEQAASFLAAWAFDVPEGLWRHILTFFREAVAAGKIREAADLLDEHELGERWRPLREALEALARRNPNYLRRVAPEVRKPAEAILEELTAPREGVTEETHAQEDAASPEPLAPSKKPPKKSRAKA